MVKRQSALMIISAIILLLVVIFFTYYYTRPQLNNDAINTVTYDTITDNELVILHLNNPVVSDKVGVTLTLTAHTKTDDSLNTIITATAADGTSLGSLNFDHLDDTETLGDYRFRLVSATTSAVQVLAIATSKAQ